MNSLKRNSYIINLAKKIETTNFVRFSYNSYDGCYYKEEVRGGVYEKTVVNSQREYLAKKYLNTILVIDDKRKIKYFMAENVFHDLICGTILNFARNPRAIINIKRLDRYNVYY